MLISVQFAFSESLDLTCLECHKSGVTSSERKYDVCIEMSESLDLTGGSTSCGVCQFECLLFANVSRTTYALDRTRISVQFAFSESLDLTMLECYKRGVTSSVQR